jgi:hypothetical protein
MIRRRDRVPAPRAANSVIGVIVELLSVVGY